MFIFGEDLLTVLGGSKLRFLIYWRRRNRREECKQPATMERDAFRRNSLSQDLWSRLLVLELWPPTKHLLIGIILALNLDDYLTQAV